MVDQVLSGLTAGSWYALLALAIVLVLKATDVPNFAMAEMGLFPAFVMWTLMDEGINYWLALLAALVVGAALALGIERVFIRPILAESHFASVLMTIGVFVGLNSVIQLLWGSRPRDLVSPFEGSFDFLGERVTYGQVLSLVLGAAIAIGLISFFRTPWGVRMRAIAEDRVTPRLLGVPIGRVFSVSWVMAGIIATLALVLQSQSTLLTDQNGSSLILKGFVAATIGGFSSVTGAFLGGLALGVLENLAGHYFGSASRLAVAMLAIIVILLLRPEGLFGRARPREV